MPALAAPRRLGGGCREGGRRGSPRASQLQEGAGNEAGRPVREEPRAWGGLEAPGGGAGSQAPCGRHGSGGGPHWRRARGRAAGRRDAGRARGVRRETGIGPAAAAAGFDNLKHPLRQPSGVKADFFKFLNHEMVTFAPK